MNKYDMNVDYSVLEEIEGKIKNVSERMNETVNGMITSLNYSQNYLSGLQFERAREVTELCINQTKENQLRMCSSAIYLRQLKDLIQEYNRCKYVGD